MNRVLLTGFGAYAEETDNPSGVIARRFDGARVEGADVVGRVLPVATEEVRAVLVEAIDEIRPDVVLVTGVAPGRASPAVERVAINMRDFPIPDIDGNIPIDRPIDASGPDAYLSTLPIKAIVDGWHSAGIPGYVSNTAGTYLCNQTMYLARHLCSARAGMVHLPATPARAAAELPPPPSMSPSDLEESVRLAISVAVTHRGPDLHLGAGAIS
ncbi:peptidase C15 [Nocardia cyriacigeorgica]|uniref:pyroglutamyl-peptidase I family protein n=1 Tax=Nocardia cyriacigeorgica TaxID=135487 RepID=UPI001894CAD8|nr:peptidase C15 [Nocardia cyriacigeorgica]MBF6440243.1 peptidase C15 [Nocardia cyriacigeorgica]